MSVSVDRHVPANHVQDILVPVLTRDTHVYHHVTPIRDNIVLAAGVDLRDRHLYCTQDAVRPVELIRVKPVDDGQGSCNGIGTFIIFFFRQC